MPWATHVPFLVWLISTSVFLGGLWFFHPKNTATVTLFWFNFVLYQSFWFLTVNWVHTNYYLRLIPIVVIFVLMFRFYRRLKPSYVLGRPPAPLWPGRSPADLAWLFSGLALLLVFGFVNVKILMSYRVQADNGDPLLMLLPVRKGMYIITNGGNGELGWGMNNRLHAWPGAENQPDERMIYAVDVVETNMSGGLLIGGRPRLQNYQGFMDPVYAPCPGSVVFVEDGHPDVLPPGQGETVLGNYLVLQCNQFYITLGGFKRESFYVKEGDQIRFGMMLGQVGASGQPSVPHLHIHATVNGVTGDPVPMIFDGLWTVDQFAVRNQIFIPQD